MASFFFLSFTEQENQYELKSWVDIRVKKPSSQPVAIRVLMESAQFLIR